MAEVVKDGKFADVDNWKTEVVCEKKDEFDQGGCGAVIAVTEKDLVMMHWKGTHSCKHYTAIKCPQCGKYNRVRDVPGPIWERFNTPRRRKYSIFDGFGDSLL